MSDQDQDPNRTERRRTKGAAAAAVGSRIKQGASRLGSDAAQSVGRMNMASRIGFGLSVIALCAIAVGFVAILSLTTLDEFETSEPVALRFEDATGEPLMVRGEMPSGYATLDAMSEHLPNAVIAIEDRRFYDHKGIDMRSVSRAAVANAAAGEVVEGGSTISQQLIKISYLEPERTFRRKFHEALLTRQLERKYTKDEILEKYMNSVYLGSGARGMVSASHVYFGKPVSDLSLAESAVLAATIQLPSAVNPFTDPERVRTRASQAVHNMLADGMIDEGQANAAIADLTVMSPSRTQSGPYGGWFADVVSAQTETLAQRFRNPGKVRTTLEPALQDRAEAAVEQVLGGTGYQAALVALRPDGAVAAMVGGRDYADSQFNRVTQAKRQPGSTFKTFVYLTALAEDWSPNDRIADAPIDIDGYEPQNYGDRFHGEVTLATAFAESYNAAAVNLGAQIGFDRVAETARLLGIDAEMSETPSLALGASEVTLLDLTEAYGAIATGRMPFQSHFVTGIATEDTGEFYPFNWPEPEIGPRAQRLMAVREPMANMLRAVVTDGTGSAVQAVPGAVGKTGTTQSWRDALFVGWGNGLVVGVWVGNDDNSPMDEVTGGSLPAQIWAAFLSGDTSAPVVEAPAATPEPEASEQVAAVETQSDAGDMAQDRVGDGTAGEPTFPEGVKSVDAPPSPDESVESLRSTLRAAQNGEPIDTDRVRQVVADLISQTGTPVAQVQSCNIAACDRAYRSFRASDCTFQPYGGGPRKICDR
ncbi:MAG: PBP1A family penicillin-binding protein [Pseudomonadota bacterium]|nr:PBP1A family penicillin-binding protein [Pseudomonadota bacterium]